MSALPPIADIQRIGSHVRFVPEADMANAPVCPGLALSSSETSIGTTTHKRQQDRPGRRTWRYQSQLPRRSLCRMKKEVAMHRYQSLNIETFHLIICGSAARSQ